MLAYYKAALHLAVMNLLTHNNISQICYCCQIVLETAVVNCSFLTIWHLWWLHLFCWRWYISNQAWIRYQSCMECRQQGTNGFISLLWFLNRFADDEKLWRTWNSFVSQWEIIVWNGLIIFSVDERMKEKGPSTWTSL